MRQVASDEDHVFDHNNLGFLQEHKDQVASDDDHHDFDENYIFPDHDFLMIMVIEIVSRILCE